MAAPEAPRRGVPTLLDGINTKEFPPGSMDQLAEDLGNHKIPRKRIAEGLRHTAGVMERRASIQFSRGGSDAEGEAAKLRSRTRLEAGAAQMRVLADRVAKLKVSRAPKKS